MPATAAFADPPHNLPQNASSYEQTFSPGTHPKVVYNKDGCCNTHFFRLANANDEPPENHYHDWRYPPIVGWDGWPTTALRDTLMNADFGAATIKTKDGRFEDLLTASKPGAIPFVPTA